MTHRPLISHYLEKTYYSGLKITKHVRVAVKQNTNTHTHDRTKNNSTRDEVVRLKSKVDTGSLVMLRDDGSNDTEWFLSLDNYFESNYGDIGRCLTDPTGYLIRMPWSSVKYLEFQRYSGMSDQQLAKYRIERTKLLYNQRENDLVEYTKMFGIVRSTLSKNSRDLFVSPRTMKTLLLSENPRN